MRLTLIFRSMVLEDIERTPKGDFKCASIMPGLAILLCLYFLPIMDVSFLLRLMIITSFHPPCFYFSLRLNNCPISCPESDVYETYFVSSLFEVNTLNRIYGHVICVTSARNKVDFWESTKEVSFRRLSYRFSPSEFGFPANVETDMYHQF